MRPSRLIQVQKVPFGIDVLSLPFRLATCVVYPDAQGLRYFGSFKAQNLLG